MTHVYDEIDRILLDLNTKRSKFKKVKKILINTNNINIDVAKILGGGICSSVEDSSINDSNNDLKFTGGWISGFIQSDGCFTITFEKKSTGLFIKPKPIFVLTQDASEEKLFKSLREFLDVGYITRNKTDVSYYITSLKGLKNILFPILDKNPLKYGKLKAYLIFKNIVEEMLNKKHLNLDGLLCIIYASFNLNVETGRRTKESKDNLLNFLESKHGKLPTPDELARSQPVSLIHSVVDASNCNNSCLSGDDINKSPISLDFIWGLIDGDGSFNVTFQIKPYRRVRVNFTVVQETSCSKLLHELKSYFSCGAVYDLPSAASRFQVENIDLMLNNIKPILDKIKLNTYKAKNYDIAMKVCEIIRIKGYKTDDALKEIVELAYDSNKFGKRRRISKEEFIRKISES